MVLHQEIYEEDQRFTENRPDVASFTTEILSDDITLAGRN